MITRRTLLTSSLAAVGISGTSSIARLIAEVDSHPLAFKEITTQGSKDVKAALRQTWMYMRLFPKLCIDPHYPSMGRMGISIEEGQGLRSLGRATFWARDWTDRQPWTLYDPPHSQVPDLKIYGSDEKDLAYPNNLTYGYLVENSKEKVSREILARFDWYGPGHTIVIGEMQNSRGCNRKPGESAAIPGGDPKTIADGQEVGLFTPPKIKPIIEYRAFESVKYRPSVDKLTCIVKPHREVIGAASLGAAGALHESYILQNLHPTQRYNYRIWY